MKYFAYGSNMSVKRLRQRVPGAVSLGVFALAEHELRFHKISHADNSGKCDAWYTGRADSLLLGVLYEIDPADKFNLDRAEGLGYGYDEKEVWVYNADGFQIQSFLYYATEFDDSCKPYTWYLQHVLTGAHEAGLPEEYIARIEAVQAVRDYDPGRELEQLAIYR